MKKKNSLVKVFSVRAAKYFFALYRSIKSRNESVDVTSRILSSLKIIPEIALRWFKTRQNSRRVLNQLAKKKLHSTTSDLKGIAMCVLLYDTSF